MIIARAAKSDALGYQIGVAKTVVVRRGVCRGRPGAVAGSRWPAARVANWAWLDVAWRGLAWLGLAWLVVGCFW